MGGARLEATDLAGDAEAPPIVLLHEEALEVLPGVLRALGASEPILVGHSDGATIALIHAAAHPVRAVVAMAPHVFVEGMCLDEIRAVKELYEAGGLRDRMARHHSDPDAAFYGWNDVWLDPGFRDWDIRDVLPRVACPVLLIQGRHDQYATMGQLDAIEAAVAGPVERLEPDSRHAPHLEAPDATLAAIARFVRRVAGAAPR